MGFNPKYPPEEVAERESLYQRIHAIIIELNGKSQWLTYDDYSTKELKSSLSYWNKLKSRK